VFFFFFLKGQEEKAHIIQLLYKNQIGLTNKKR